MIDAIVTVKDGKIAGRTAHDAEALASLEGGEYRVVFTQPRGRSLSQLNLFWKLCELVADNMPEGERWTKKGVSYVLKIETGHFTPVQAADGTYYRLPASIAFNNMPPEEFGGLLNQSFDVVAEKFSPELSAAVRAEIERLIAPREQRRAA